MTCIVGLVDRVGTVWMGSDRYHEDGNNSGDMILRGTPKVQRIGPCLIGVAGYSAIASILRTQRWPAKTDQPAWDWLVRELLPALRKECQERGLLTVRDGVHSLAAEMLIGMQGKLFQSNAVFDVMEVTRGYHAVGYRGAALGALYATRFRPLSSKERLLLALLAEEAHSAFVRGPFDIECLTMDGSPVRSGPADDPFAPSRTVDYDPLKERKRRVRKGMP